MRCEPVALVGCITSLLCFWCGGGSCSISHRLTPFFTVKWSRHSFSRALLCTEKKGKEFRWSAPLNLLWEKRMLFLFSLFGEEEGRRVWKNLMNSSDAMQSFFFHLMYRHIFTYLFFFCCCYLFLLKKKELLLDAGAGCCVRTMREHWPSFWL